MAAKKQPAVRSNKTKPRVAAKRPDRGPSRDAFDAGVDYARDLIAWHPDWDADQLVREAEGCVMDLCGGANSDADWAFDGAQAAISDHFE